MLFIKHQYYEKAFSPQLFLSYQVISISRFGNSFIKVGNRRCAVLVWQNNKLSARSARLRRICAIYAHASAHIFPSC